MKIRPLLRLLALAGLAISVYLLVLKLTGRISYLAGCGEGSGCANVLGSRWSQFFHVPVTAFSSGLYLVLLVSTWRPSRLVFGGLAVCFAGAALWFYGILLFELKAFCPWCAAAHFIGLCCAFLLWQYLKQDRKLPRGAGRGALLGLVAVAVLVLGQLFGPVPDTHTVSTTRLAEDPEGESAEPSIHSRGEGRIVKVLGEGKGYNTTSLPHLGSPEAPHVVVKYFDYACDACREMDEQLAEVMEAYPGQLTVILLPVPLNHACNEHYPPGLEDLPHACELARLALAGWRADPEVFAEIHEVLFTRPVLDPTLAEIAVAQLVGEEAFAEAREDPWIEELLAANRNDFRQLISETVRMPKLLIGRGQVLQGLPKGTDALRGELEKAFGLSAGE